MEKAKHINVNSIIEYDEHFGSYPKHLRSRCVSFYDERSNIKKSSAGFSTNKKFLQFASAHFIDAAKIIMERQTYLNVRCVYSEVFDTYFSTLNFYKEMIERKQINLIIFNHLPHHFNTYCLYLTSKFLKIDTLIVSKLAFSGFRYYVERDLNTRGWSIKNNIEISSQIETKDQQIIDELKARKRFTKPIYMEQKYNRQVANFLSKLISRNVITIFVEPMVRAIELGPFRVQKHHWKVSQKTRYLDQTSNLVIRHYFDVFKQRLQNAKLNKVFAKYARNADPNDIGRFVLFAPNYQPEATTHPVASIYSDPLLCIRLLRQRLPAGVTICYREHEDVFNPRLEAFRCRNESFYRDIASIPGVLLCARGMDQVELLNNCEAVFAQTSNVALEAAIRGRVSVLFGPAWFDFMDSVHSFFDFNFDFSTDTKSDVEKLTNISKYTARLEDDGSDTKTEVQKFYHLLCHALEILKNNGSNE